MRQQERTGARNAINVGVRQLYRQLLDDLELSRDQETAFLDNLASHELATLCDPRLTAAANTNLDRQVRKLLSLEQYRKYRAYRSGLGVG